MSSAAACAAFGIGLGIADCIHDQESGLAILVEPEESAEFRIVDVDDADRLAEHLRREIGLEIDRDAVGENAAAVERDAKQFAHLAVRAVGADEILAMRTRCSRAAVDVS